MSSPNPAASATDWMSCSADSTITLIIKPNVCIGEQQSRTCAARAPCTGGVQLMQPGAVPCSRARSASSEKVKSTSRLPPAMDSAAAPYANDTSCSTPRTSSATPQR